MPFDVIVSVGGTGPIFPTGTMQLFDNGVLVATSSALVNGEATISVSLDAEGQHTLTTTYTGDSVYNSGLPATAVTTITPPFAVSFGQGPSTTILAGQTATYPLSVGTTPNFAGVIALTCSGAPAGTTCSVSPTTVNPTGNLSAQPTLTLTTTLNAQLKRGPFKGVPILFCGVFAGLICACSKRPKKARRLSVVVISLLLGSIGCGGGGGSGSGSGTIRPPTNFTITVTATSGTHVASNFEKFTILHL